jgi:hypothetical protein
MTPEQFCYWLQGYYELTNNPDPSDHERIIQDHLKTVFDKQTPVGEIYHTTTPVINPASSQPPNPFKGQYKVIC